MIILQDSVELQQSQEIKISDAISYLNTNAEQPFSDRPLFRPEILPGREFKDTVSGVTPVTSISGTRYGVVNNTVTQFEVNQPHLEDDGLRGCPAFTQLCQQSETLTDAVWVKSRSAISVLSETLNGMTLWNFYETVTTGVHQLFQTAAFGAIADNSVIGLVHTVKSNGRNIQIYAKLKNGSTVYVGNINLTTGVTTSIRAGSIVIALDKGNGFYQIFATVPVGVGATSPFIYIGLLNGSTESYTGDGVSGVYTSQPTFINFGVNGIPFIPPYVPNNTTGSISVVSEASTATTGMSFDLDGINLSRLKTALRGPNAQGHLELEFVSNFDSGWLPSGVGTNINILSVNNNNVIGSVYYQKSSGGVLAWKNYDGIYDTTVASTGIVVGQSFKISLDWGTHSTGQKMRLTVNGVKSALANFSGSFGSQDLRFFFGNAIHAGWIVNDSLKVMDRPQW